MQRRPAAAARSKAWRGVARCGHVAQNGVGWRLTDFPGSKAAEPPLEEARGDDFKRDFKPQRDERHRCGAHVAYGPTLARA